MRVDLNCFFRSISCSVLVNEFMGMAVSYALADKRFLNDTKPKVSQYFIQYTTRGML